MSRILALANFKGGVGKTTGAVNLAAGLAELGDRSLVVDLDSQGAATRALGVENDGAALLECLKWRESLGPLIAPSAVPDVEVVPGGPRMAEAERDLLTRIGTDSRLQACLERTEGRWDWVLLDCPAGTGVLTINALVAATGVLLPIDGQPMALQGLAEFLKVIEEIREGGLNRALDIVGVLPSRCQPRRKAHQRGLEALNEAFPGKVGPVIRENVALVEAPRNAKPVTLYAPRSNGAEDYRAAARWLRGLLPG